MSARRPARPFLARRQAAVSRARLRPRQHDPRRARALRGDRRARLSRPRARLAGARSTATTPIARPAAISSPPTTPRAWWCGRTPPADEATPNANGVAAQNLVRLALVSGAGRLARAGRPAVRRRCFRSRTTTCSCIWRCSTRSTCGCARPRSWWRARAGRRTRSLRLRCALPFLDRVVLRAPTAEALSAGAPGAGEDQGDTGARSLHLRRRALLAAGDGARAHRRGGEGDAVMIGASQVPQGLRP